MQSLWKVRKKIIFKKRCHYFQGIGNISSINGQKSHSGYYVLCCTGSAYCKVGLLASFLSIYAFKQFSPLAQKTTAVKHLCKNEC